MRCLNELPRAELTRYQLEISKFLLKYDFFEECPSAGWRRAMGDDQLYSGISIWIIFNLKIIPLLTPFTSPFKGGLLFISDPEGRGIKPITIKMYLK